MTHLRITYLTLIASVSALGLMGASVASAHTEVELKNVAARVVVTPENRSDVDLKVLYGNAKVPVIMVHSEGDKFVADGKLKMHNVSCEANGARISGLGTVAQADLPVIYIRVPLDAKVAVGGATYGKLGASKTLDFSEGGCGSWTIGNVAGTGEINIGGSGDLVAGQIGDLQVNIGGSGNFKATSATALQANIGGHGDIMVGSVKGPTAIVIGGSGRVNVSDGQMPHMEVTIAGSGDVRYGGEVKDLEVNIFGSGDVHVKTVTGNVSKSVMGSGNIVIGK